MKYLTVCLLVVIFGVGLWFAVEDRMPANAADADTGQMEKTVPPLEQRKEQLPLPVYPLSQDLAQGLTQDTALDINDPRLQVSTEVEYQPPPTLPPALEEADFQQIVDALYTPAISGDLDAAYLLAALSSECETNHPWAFERTSTHCTGFTPDDGALKYEMLDISASAGHAPSALLYSAIPSPPEVEADYLAYDAHKKSVIRNLERAFPSGNLQVAAMLSAIHLNGEESEAIINAYAYMLVVEDYMSLQSLKDLLDTQISAGDRLLAEEKYASLREAFLSSGRVTSSKPVE